MLRSSIRLDHDLLTQPRDLLGAVAELAQDFVGMLPALVVMAAAGAIELRFYLPARAHRTVRSPGASRTDSRPGAACRTRGTAELRRAGAAESGMRKFGNRLKELPECDAAHSSLLCWPWRRSRRARTPPSRRL